MNADCTSKLGLCDQALDACGKAVDARKKEVELCNLGLTQSADQNTMLQREVQDKDQALGAWYRNPFVVGTVGVLLGMLATGYALKK